MDDEEIEKIARAIAAKIGEPGGPAMLGCGSASSSQPYNCSGSYTCSGSSYTCGGAGQFMCAAFRCDQYFYCYNNFTCTSSVYCMGRYNP